MDKRKIGIAIALGGLAIAFFYFDVSTYLSFDYLKASQAKLSARVSDHAWLSTLLYVGCYIIATALSLPGATILTLAGGALFGLVKGTLMVSVASTCGATLAFLVSRFMFRDVVERKFSKHLEKMHNGVEEEGWMYLLTMRLIPAIPFFVINLAMGLTKMKTLTYAFISLLGMFPATVIYVNAGSELSKLSSLKGILSPKMITAFVLLGVFPLVAKQILKRLKKSKDKSK